MAIKAKIFFACIFFSLGSLQGNAQEDSISLQQPLSQNQEAIIKWVEVLYEHGVRIDRDTIILSKEVQRIIVDDSLKAFLFPITYTWETALALMQQMDLKAAFWFLINLYPQHKELVMKTVLAYDELFEMDLALLASFYTFSMIDPQVCDLGSGKPVIIRPDIVEVKLASVKEMVGYIVSYRAQQQKN